MTVDSSDCYANLTDPETLLPGLFVFFKAGFPVVRCLGIGGLIPVAELRLAAFPVLGGDFLPLRPDEEGGRALALLPEFVLGGDFLPIRPDVEGGRGLMLVAEDLRLTVADAFAFGTGALTKGSAFNFYFASLRSCILIWSPLIAPQST